MTRKYWTGIFVAMLAIFGVGLLVARGVGRVKTLVNSVAENIPSPLGLMTKTGFKVDGDEMGDIQRLQFMRSAPGQVDSAVLTVKIDDAADVQRVGSCILRATNAHPFGSGTRFVCTSHSDSAKLGLVPFGHIEITPGNQKITFFVAKSVEDDMHQHAYRGSGSADSGDVDIVVADKKFSITVNGRELVSANDEGDGGSLVIRDANGNALVQIHGDSNGGSVKVNDANGKSVVNIHGGNSKPKEKP